MITFAIKLGFPHFLGYNHCHTDKKATNWYSLLDMKKTITEEELIFNIGI